MRPDGPRDPVTGPDSGPEPPFPLKLNGKVIKGFGRGSKELGIPTANIPLSGLSVGGNDHVESGVYYGWAGLSSSRATNTHPPGEDGKYKLMDPQVNDTLNQLLSAQEQSSASHTGSVYPMVMSIGYNPFYNNTVRSVEVHIMQDFTIDFYDTHMNLIILGFIRPEYDYVSLDKLVEDIKTDIDVAGRSLSREAYLMIAKDSYLLEFTGRDEIAS